jgi:hypothetical protein
MQVHEAFVQVNFLSVKMHVVFVQMHFLSPQVQQTFPQVNNLFPELSLPGFDVKISGQANISFFYFFVYLRVTSWLKPEFLFFLCVTSRLKNKKTL